MIIVSPSPFPPPPPEKGGFAANDEKGGFAAEGLPEPTRFGDWEVRGRCSDF